MATLGEPTHLTLFRVIAGSPRMQEFGQRRLSLIFDDALILHLD
jgi:hypothetical protein